MSRSSRIPALSALTRCLQEEASAIAAAAERLSSDEVEAAWRLYTPLLELIEDSPWQLPVHPYESLTWGPAAADALLARDGLLWRRP